MRKCIWVLFVMLMLCACGAEETLETVADDWIVPAAVEPREIELNLPGEIAESVMAGDSSRLYIHDGYSVIVQTVSSGDLDSTIRSMTGFGQKELTVIHTKADACERYEFVWSSAGEDGDQVGHGIILDDGSYHYCLSVLQDVQTMSVCQIIWDEVYQSFRLA